MQCIADANVLFPLIYEDHAQHFAARQWWETRGDSEIGLCLPVRMALLRLLSNRKVVGHNVLRPERAWQHVQALSDDPRMVIADRVPATHAGFWLRNVRGREPSPDIWTDAWLAALAQSLDCEMVTFDRGFRAFKGLKLQLLASGASA